MPKVSVIIPVFNTERFLRECLDSVCNQTLSDIEIICVNDASQDNSLEILKEYSSKDKRIKIINFTENRGVSVARNAGINEACGEYLGFVDSDDFISPEFYEKLYKKAARSDVEVVKGNIYDVDSEGKNPVLTDFYAMNDKIRENKAYFYYGFTSAIYKKDFVQAYKLKFPENISYFEDPYFSIFASIYLKQIDFDDSVCYFYIRHNNSACKNTNTYKKFQGTLESIKLILERLNHTQIPKKDYLIYLSFLLRQTTRWCSDIEIPSEATFAAVDMLTHILKNKYGEQELLRVYFEDEIYFKKLAKEKSRKEIFNKLREKIGK